MTIEEELRVPLLFAMFIEIEPVRHCPICYTRGYLHGRSMKGVEWNECLVCGWMT